MPQCLFSRIRERDMDVLFLNAMVTDYEFGKLVLSKTKYSGANFVVKNVELSHTEPGLGESDITVIVEIGGKRVGLLIEDKIDAIAMPEQHNRYHKRAKKGIDRHDYDAYEVFIFCPMKYYELNSEASKYEHFLSYEELQSFFLGKDDILSNIRAQQLSQAIEIAKKPPVVNVDENANAFFRQYKAYQEENYPKLDLRTSETSNGWWAHYGTRLGKVHVMHKAQEGYVDLTFPKAADSIESIIRCADWLNSNGVECVGLKTGKAASIRVRTPALDFHESFDLVTKEDLNKCFETITKLCDYANNVNEAYRIAAKYK